MNIIYGAGKYGRLLLDFFNSQFVKVDYFCQTKAYEGTDIYGINVISFDELKSCLDDSCTHTIFIAMADEYTSHEIKKQLLFCFMGKTNVIECGEFVKKNLERSSDDKYCLICGKYGKFNQAGNKFELFKQHHVIGAGYRENCVCPNCGSFDRSRWIYYCLKKYTGIFNEKCNVLHFAPHSGDAVIREEILKNRLCNYYGADLDDELPFLSIDMTDIPFKEDYFDYIIANHILEHIPDEHRALSELKRVLKPNGKIILSFPICPDREYTDECVDGSITEEDKIERFGQADHIRLYGLDYKDRIERVGLKVKTHRPCDEMDIEEIRFACLMEDDLCCVVTK